MASYIDCFGRNAVIEIIPYEQKSRITIAIRKERGTVYESWDEQTAIEIMKDLELAIMKIGNKDVGK